MKIIFLASARDDLTWFRRYYKQIFPAGAANAQEYYKRALTTLRAYPFAGHSETGDRRKLTIPRTPFILVYRTTSDRIEVLHIRDGRSNHPEDSAPSGPALP